MHRIIQRLPVTVPDWAGFPVIGLVLYNISVYLASVMAHLNGAPMISIPEFLHYFVGVLFSAVVLSPALRRLAGRERDGSAPGDWRFVLVPSAFALFAAATHLAGVGLWRASFEWQCVLVFAQGLMLPLVYSLFFLTVPYDKTGQGFGVGVTVSMAAIVASHLGIDPGDPASTAARIDLLYGVRAASVVGLGLATAAALARWRRRSFEYSHPEPPSPEDGRNLKLLLLAVVLFFVLNGVLQAQLVPFISKGTGQKFPEIPLVLAVFCPLAGLYLDRRPVNGNRRVLQICTALFMLAPALAVLSSSPYVYRPIYALCVLAYFCATLCATRALAVLTGTAPWFCLVIAAPHFFIVIAVCVRWLIGDVVKPAPELIVPLGIVLAMGVHHLQGRLRFDPLPAEAVAEEVPPVKTEDIFEARGLSPREREVAALLIRGASAKNISEELKISDATVATHVKNILRKFGVSSQKAFLAAFIPENAKRK